jgi:hypothetical protein
MEKSLFMTVIFFFLVICLVLFVGDTYYRVNEGFDLQPQIDSVSIYVSSIPDGFYFDKTNNQITPIPTNYTTLDKVSLLSISEAEQKSKNFVFSDSLVNISTRNIPFGYYYNKDIRSLVTIPYGFVSNDGINLVAKTKTMAMYSAPTNAPEDITKYNKDVSQFQDIQYHPSEEEIKSSNNGMDIPYGSTWSIDKDGKKVVLQNMKYSTQGDILYYTPGAYRFGASNYVPAYEDSIYLSKSTKLSMVTPIENKSSTAGGFCAQHAINPDKIEEKCSTLDLDTCASTSCCVLLGGSKCVGGNAHGPTNKSVYGDVYLKNPDVYYYSGDCYGNCAYPSSFSYNPQNSVNSFNVPDISSAYSTGIPIISTLPSVTSSTANTPTPSVTTDTPTPTPSVTTLPSSTNVP